MDKATMLKLGIITMSGAIPPLAKPYPSEYVGRIVKWDTMQDTSYIFLKDGSTFYALSDTVLVELYTSITDRLEVTKPEVNVLQPSDLVALRKGDFSTDDIIRLKKEGVL